MKKVCLLGTSNTLKEAPFNEDMEFWALNDMYSVVPIERITRWFEMHNMGFLRNYRSRGTSAPHLPQLAKLTIPVYMQQYNDEVPTSIEYPLDDIMKHYGKRYFNSSIDYMLAMAIYEGYEEIHIYGVNMAFQEEYQEQRPSCEYWLGRAEGKGIKIVLPKGCDILKSYYIYGYEEAQKNDLRDKAESKIAELSKQAAEFQKNYYLSLGAKDTWEFVLKNLWEAQND